MTLEKATVMLCPEGCGCPSCGERDVARLEIVTAYVGKDMHGRDQYAYRGSKCMTCGYRWSGGP